MIICESFERFQYFNFETNFLEAKTFFIKLEYCFLVETTKIEKTSFHSKLLCQKLMLRQKESRLQNGPITKSGVLPATTLFFWKICSSFRTSYKELTSCNNDPNVHIRIFRQRWSLILGCSFPVNILNLITWWWWRCLDFWWKDLCLPLFQSLF